MMFLYLPGKHLHITFGRNPDVNRMPRAALFPALAQRIGPPAALALAMLLGGCSTAPRTATDAQGPLPLASTWSVPGAATATAAAGAETPPWWQAWNDPQLSALIDQALAANPDLQAARATLARSRALRDVAAAGLSPQLGSSAGSSRSRSGGQTSNSHSLGLDASWEPDFSGAGAAAVAAADAQAAAAGASLGATRLALVGDVAQAWLQWQGLQRRLALAADNLALQRDSLQLAQWRAGAGLATVVDVEQAQGSVSQTEASLASLSLSQRRNEHRLAVLVGVAPTALADQLAGARAQQASGATGPGFLPATGLPADLLRRRPDVVAAEHSVAAALATLNQREAERRPQFSITGRLGLQALSLAALGSGTAVLATVGANVSWPVMDGGAARAQVQAQSAALAAAQASYRSAVLSAQQDVEDNLAALELGRRQREHLQRAAAAAREVLQLARLRYQSGLIDFGTLLDAQRTAVGTDDALASADTELALSQVRPTKALGGGWQADADMKR